MADVTTPFPKTVLLDLSLEAVSLCAAGANSRAQIILAKSRKENTSMSFEELVAQLKPEQAQVVNDHVAKVLGDKDTAIAGLNQQLEALKKAKPPVPNEEEILKSLSPEVRKLFADQQDTLKTLLADRAEELAKSRFEKCKSIPVAEDSLKEVLKTASPAVCQILEAAAAAISKSLQTPAGSNASGEISETQDHYYGLLEKSAKTLMSEQPALTFEQAFDKACRQDPTTYTRYVKGAK